MTENHPTPYMNPNYNYSDPYFNNDVKFTGSAFESPGDAATFLLQLGVLLMIIFGIRNEERGN